LYESFFTTPDLNAPISSADQTYNRPGFQDVAVNYITGATITSAAVKHGAKERIGLKVLVFFKVLKKQQFFFDPTLCVRMHSRRSWVE